MRSLKLTTSAAIALIAGQSAFASLQLLEDHCSKCHNDEKLKGDFSLSHLGANPSDDSSFLWEDSLDYLMLEEMPPPEKTEITEAERQELIEFLTVKVRDYHEGNETSFRTSPRRLNNRELENSISDVLMIEDIGTHQPTATLLGDSLYHGFDTNGDTLGLSEYHLEQYIESVRNIVDATILDSKQPKTRKITVRSDDLRVTDLSNRRRDEKANRTPESIEILDIRKHAYFSNFESVPESGRYRIKLRAMGVDRNVYDSERTGIHKDDPITIRVHLGDRVLDYDLPDNEIAEIEIDEWLAKGTYIHISYLTDGLRLIGNGNFKFQYRIAHDYLKVNDPKLYQRVVTEEVPKAKFRSTAPSHWSHWTGYWQGPRPRLFGADIEGPLYESWPPKRQVALIGAKPKVKDAVEILTPIAERAWRRKPHEGELEAVAELIAMRAETLGTIEAFKEGIVALMVSPSFLLLNPEEGDAHDRFATKLSYFLKSTTPDAKLREAVHCGNLSDFESIRNEVQRAFDNGEAEEFLKEFPHAWLQLDRISFMAPDPERFPLYDKKRLSEDMINEAVAFFDHMITENKPLSEFLSANYSFINADLAKVYDVKNVPEDSILRKYTFKDRRRGGLLGMGAFLTLTADSLGTSPIHRAVYVMENFMGIHPEPPPADVIIQEPDIRQAKTIKEVLAAHTAEETCASCHKSIDPWGFAFENFDPMGAWRDHYTQQIEKKPLKQALAKFEKEDQARIAEGLPPLPRPWEHKPIAVDASNQFRDGRKYQDIVDYRKRLQSKGNRDRFVRCFVTKLLTYANGEEPKDYWELEKILEKSQENNYRIVDTIAAVIDSPLFREE